MPQRFILGQTLWNLFYDGLLELQMLEGVALVGYADDVATTVNAELIEQVANSALQRVANWMAENGIKHRRKPRL